MPAILIENGIERMIPRLFIIRGAPGVGKSTVSKSISKINSSSKKTYISVDAIQHMDMRAQSKSKEKLGIKNASILAASFLEEGFDVIMDYVYDDINDVKTSLEQIRARIPKDKSYFTQQFFLDAPLEKIVKRNQSRSGKRGEYMNTALLKKLYAKTEATKGLIENEQIINTALLSAKQTACTIVACTKGVIVGTDLINITLPEADLARAIEADGEGE